MNGQDKGSGMGLPFPHNNQNFQPHPWMPYPWQPYPFMPQPQLPPTPSANKGRGKRNNKASTSVKPWDTESDSENEFEPKNKKQTKAAAAPKQTQTRRGKRKAEGADNATSTASPAPTCGSASQQLMQRRVTSLPGYFHLKGNVAVNEIDECVACNLYEGKIILKPCGHCAFCYSCVDKLHKKSEDAQRLQLCPVSSCYEFITGWVKMYNISA